jgi:hypothetical protein
VSDEFQYPTGIGVQRRKEAQARRALRDLPEAGRLVDVMCHAGHLVLVVLDGPGRFLTLDHGDRRDYFDGDDMLAGVTLADNPDHLHLFASCPRIRIEHPVIGLCPCGAGAISWHELRIEAEAARDRGRRSTRRVAPTTGGTVR